MKKKIIIGIIITIVLTFTAFEAVYALNKEKSRQGEKLDQLEDGQYDCSEENDSGSRKDCIDGNEVCFKQEERTRNNHRMRVQDGRECGYQEINRNEFQNRYEKVDKNPMGKNEECEEGSGSKTQNKEGHRKGRI